MDYQTHTLSNGIRLVHTRVRSMVAGFALMVNAGSRDETDQQHGLAHFIEHTIFKGTRKRKAYHILNRMENVGGDLNAYTTKEETCVYATFLLQHYKRAAELISDMVFNSVFPQHELEREKEVIVEEIKSYQDSPSEQIFDEFDELFYPHHPLGRNILGTADSVKSFEHSHINLFLQRNYNTQRMVISSVADMPFERVIRIAERYFGAINQQNGSIYRYAPVETKSFYQTRQQDTHQAHCIVGFPAYNTFDPKRIRLVLLANMLGGSGLNSRLNMALRERNGLAYQVETSYSSYSDSASLCIYFGADHQRLQRCITLIDKEIKRFCTQTLSAVNLSRAKNQLMGQIAMSADNKEGQLLRMAKNFLIHKRLEALVDINRKIEAITADQIIETANEVFDNQYRATLIYT